MNLKIILFFVITVTFKCARTSKVPNEGIRTKRQLYREQLLPQKGGKIPDSAFQVDRLAANRLNKEGISVPDGILLEQRHRESHHNEYRHDLDIEKSIVRLKQTPDGRYTPIEGRYPSFENEIESTYIIRPPITENYNFILPAYRPSFGGSTFQIPSKQTHSKLFRDKNFSHRNLLNQHNLVSDLQQPRRDWTAWNTIVPEIFQYQRIGPDGKNRNGYIPDFPSFTEIPATSFICDRSGRMYPDPEAKCQAFHLCHYNGRRETFLCPPGTRFNILTNECSPWYKTQCIKIL